MKTIRQTLPCLLWTILLSFSLTCVFQGCTAPQQRVAFNSLYTTHVTVDGAVASYFALVAQGSLPTNDVPALAQDYREFQTAFNLALEIVANNTNAPAPPSVVNAASKVLAITGKAK
jgi:hypothetical protein